MLQGVVQLLPSPENMEAATLTAENKVEYEKLKESRAEVAELQKIRRYVDVVLKADAPQQIKRHEQNL